MDSVKVEFSTLAPFGMGAKNVSSEVVFAPIELPAGARYGDIFRALEDP